MSKRTSWVLCLILSACAFWSQSGKAAPANLTYQGRILKTDGTPLEHGNTSFLFEITSPNGNCVIYREQRDGVNMVNSKGIFDVPIGSGTKLFPSDPLFTLLDAFNNSIDHNCYGGALYPAGTGDGRLLKVQFHDGSGWKVISPANEIRSVPYAAYALSAEKLGSKVASDFLLKAGLPTCDANEFLIWTGSAFDCAPVSGASGGTVTQVISNSTPYLTVTNGTSTPAFTLNVGTTAGSVAAGNDARFSDSRAPTGAASGDLGGTYPAPTVTKIQGAAVSASAPTSGQILIYNSSQYTPTSLSGDVTISEAGVVTLKNTGTAGTHVKVTTDAQGRVLSGSTLLAADIPSLDWGKITSGKPTTLSGYGITDAILNTGDTPSVQSGTIAARPSAGVNGRLYVGTDDNSLYRDTGSAWVKIGDGAGANGVTAVTASSPLSASAGTTPNITIAQANATTNGYLSFTDWNNFNAKLSTASTFAGDISGISSTISVDRIKGKTVSPVAYTAGQTLRYDGGNWVNALLGFADISGAVATSQLPVVPVSKGGTGLTSGTSGGLVYFDSASTMASTAAGTAHQVLRVPGAGGAPSFGAMDLAQSAAVTGTLSVSNGGTGTSLLTANRLLASNGSGSAITDFTCGMNQLVTFDGNGIMGCTNFSSSGLFAHGGNSFGTPAILGTNDAQPLNFETANTTRMTLTSTGTLGIGTNAPTAQLEVRTTTASASKNILMYNTDASGGAYLSAKAGSNNISIGTWGASAGGSSTYIESNSTNPLKIVTYSNTAITFSTNTSGGGNPERMRIDNVGNVGIGTLAPSSPLHVSSTAASPPAVLSRMSLSPALTANTATNLHASWNTILPGSSYDFTGGLYGAVNRIEDSAAQTGNINSAIGSVNDVHHKSVSTINAATGLQGIIQNTSTGAITTAKAASFTVSNTGGGTIDTGYGVYIGAVAGTAKYGLYQDDVNSTNVFTGKLGVGTSAPNTTLHVEGNAFVKDKLYVYDTSAWGSTTPAIALAIGDNDTGLEWVSDGVLQIWTNAVPRIHLALNGNIGIGTTTPGYKLDVNGTLRAFGITDSSDVRLKRDIASLDPATELDKILQVQGVSYNWKNPEHGRRPQLGFIAQELEKIYPELREPVFSQLNRRLHDCF
ncbi:tail fiber domain-containing protein [Bdellovibrio bacteriovorus]|uniref:tail fiber domain-containing protein n=1 Tax=Bdellovibrio bacteriovorus TaxID=959 RepID=UPI0021D151B7|nr:tail fiber domain-containing protein [Bdellovibrio bacteriovorus]UXR63770.1 tail fiber domain-containing protein [Bdellovibrio bacteriovorus]